MLDTTREVEIPEGITLSLPVAGYVCRALAFMIDLVIRAIVIWVIALIFVWFGEFGNGLLFLSIFLVEWFYPVVFEVFSFGQTPGKKLMGILVVNDDGTPIDWSSSIVRNLLRFADFFPLFYVFGILSMLFSKDFKRLGDFAAGTLVIHKADSSEQNLVQTAMHKAKRSATHGSGKKSDLEGVAPRTALTLNEQSAIISFAERAAGMSKARVHELANYLKPWLNQDKLETHSESATIQLTRIARWLRGQT